MFGLLIAFIGVFLSTGINFHETQSNAKTGVLLALTAAFLYALATLATRKLKEFDPAQLAGVQLLLGAMVLAPMVHFEIVQFSTQTWISLLTLGLVHTALMYKLMYSAFQKLRADTVASLSYIYPLVALAADALVLHTQINQQQIWGIFLILFAVVGNHQSGKISSFVSSRIFKKK